MRLMKRLLACLCAVLTACSNAPGTPDAAAPELILHNGKIVTVDANFSIAQAVAIRGGK